MMCPCQNCTERYPGCHDNCGAYTSWKAERDGYKAEKRRQDLVTAVMRESVARTIDKIRRNR